MNDVKPGLAEAELGRLSDRGCIFLAIKVTAEVDMSPVVIGLIPLKAMVFADQSCCMPSRSFFRFADLTMLIERPT